MTAVSARTAELALNALGVAIRLAAPKRNGTPLPEDIRVALVELHAASSARGTTLDGQSSAVRPSEEITVADAAARLGISERAVTKRLTTGKLAGRKAAGVWLIDWQTKE